MPTQPQQATSFHFSTAGMPVPQRRQAIGGLRERGLLPIEPLDDSVSLSIAKCFLPGVGILAGTLSGLRQQAVAQAKDVSDDLFLGINLAGRSVATQRGREAEFGDGEGILMSLAEGAFAITRPTPAKMLGLRMPRPALTALLASGVDEHLRVVAGDLAPLKLLASYLRAIMEVSRDLGARLSPETNSLTATHLQDLMALCIGATRDAAAGATQSVRAARLQAIKADIVVGLADPSLTVAALAARQGVTPRYVHKLFESDGTTCTQFILRRRLDRAYRRLCDPRFAERSITSIAMEAGFGDLSYFNRVFRRQYSGTPSDIRNRTLSDGPR
jgi:AraC-like DNA-binding protein